MPRPRWAAGTVTLRMRNRNMRGPIKTGQGNTCDSRSSQSSNCRSATFGSADNVRTDGRTDTHKKINRRGDFVVKIFVPTYRQIVKAQGFLTRALKRPP